MKFLGIDYGSKRVGVALSDDGAKLAFPKVTLMNDKKLLENIKRLCKEESVSEIVLGESLDGKGEPNTIMSKVEQFKVELESEVGIPVHFEAEFMTSMHADILPEKRDIAGRGRGGVERGGVGTDASAAALILQRFLDKR